MSVKDWDRAKAALQRIWGYENFRPPQGEIIRTLLSGKDALVILPTGGGKSICFQLPAILQPGLTLVVSPLVALMENQVNQLQKLGLPGALLHGELSRQQRQQTLAAIARQELQLLYLSPETLLSPPVWEIVSQPEIKITRLILDEVHCLIQWGTTFRPAYRRLGAVRRSLLQHKPKETKIAVAAFTATADLPTQKAIARALELQQPQTFLISPYRANLDLNIQTVWTPKGRKQQTLNFIRKKKKQSGLVYVRSRRDSETLAQWFQSLNYVAQSYHAGLSSTERRKIENSWLKGETQFVVCTSAFGMGIDKPDCAWIVHFQAPELLSEYLQEVGRGGRNGKLAEALTLVSEPSGWLNPEDKQRSQFFTQNLHQQYSQARQLARHIPNEGAIDKIEKNSHTAIALGILHSLGAIYWKNPFYYQKKAIAININRSFKERQLWQRQLQQYLSTKQCRWQFLLLAFGFTQEATSFSCGHCDNCRDNR